MVKDTRSFEERRKEIEKQFYDYTITAEEFAKKEEALEREMWITPVKGSNPIEPNILNGLIKDSVRMLERLKANNPDYVFLLASSAVPDGWILKEGWKKAFPGQKVPRFYTIDPTAHL